MKPTPAPGWTLDHLEETFQGVLLGKTPSQDLLPAIAEPNEAGAKVSKADLLNIYGNGYVARLEGVMAENFEGLLALMGEGDFYDLCHAYLRGHPSRVRSVRWTGDKLAAFLSETSPWSETPALADMAAFDWARGVAFDAPGTPDGVTPPVTGDDLGALAPADWPGLCLAPQDALQIVTFAYDVDAFYQNLQRGKADPPPPAPLAQPGHMLVWRDPETLAVKYRRAGNMEARALRMARAGKCFADICEAVADRDPACEPALEAARLIQTWLAHGLIATIEA